MFFSQTFESFALSSSTFQISFWEVWIPFTFVCWFSHLKLVESSLLTQVIWVGPFLDSMLGIWWYDGLSSVPPWKGSFLFSAKKIFFIASSSDLMGVLKNPVSLKTLSCYYFYCTFLPPAYFVFSSLFFPPDYFFCFHFFISETFLRSPQIWLPPCIYK